MSPSRSSRPSRARRTNVPASGVIVRPATLADLDSIVGFRMALLDAERESPVYGRRREDAEARARRKTPMFLASGREITWIAEQGKRPIGMLRCMERRGSPLLRPARFGYIASVYVDPAFRRRGVLTQLVDAATTWCRARGLTEMRLHATIENAAATAAWDHLGFAPVEVLHRREIRPAPGT